MLVFVDVQVVVATFVGQGGVAGRLGLGLRMAGVRPSAAHSGEFWAIKKRLAEVVSIHCLFSPFLFSKSLTTLKQFKRHFKIRRTFSPQLSTMKNKNDQTIF